MSAEKRKRFEMRKDGGGRLVPCKNKLQGCEIKIPIENMTEHTVSCQFRNATPQFDESKGRKALSQSNNVKCPLESFGCNFVGTKAGLEEHEHKAMQKHLELLVLFGTNTDLKALQAHNRLQSISSDLRFKLKQIDHRVNAIQEGVEETHNMLRILTEEQKLMQRKWEHNNQQLLERVQVMNNALRNKDEQIAHLQRELRDRAELERVARFRLEMLEDVVYGNIARLRPAPRQEQPLEVPIQEEARGHGFKVMEIRGFAKEKRKAIANGLTTLYSEPFLTTNGVEMRVNVRLNGDESEGGPCMTVFVAILKGLNDELLDWPFRGSVSLYIYDPEMSDYEFIDSFDTDPDHLSFQKPYTKRNIGYGFLKSISHIDLGRMVKEDKLVIKVRVNTAVN